MQDDEADAAPEAAGLRIQAASRGGSARKPPALPDSSDDEQDAALEAAALRIQAVARGRSARKPPALPDSSSDEEELQQAATRAAARRRPLRFGEMLGAPPPMVCARMQEALEAEEMSAVEPEPEPEPEPQRRTERVYSRLASRRPPVPRARSRWRAERPAEAVPARPVEPLPTAAVQEDVESLHWIHSQWTHINSRRQLAEEAKAKAEAEVAELRREAEYCRGRQEEAEAERDALRSHVAELEDRLTRLRREAGSRTRAELARAARDRLAVDEEPPPDMTAIGSSSSDEECWFPLRAELPKTGPDGLATAAEMTTLAERMRARAAQQLQLRRSLVVECAEVLEGFV